MPGHPSLGRNVSVLSTVPPASPLLAEGLVRTTLAHLRLDKDQRRKAVETWYAESGLGADHGAAVERGALVKAVVAALAVKVS